MKPPVYSLQPARDSPKVSGQVLADVPGHLEHVEAFGRASIPFPQRSPGSTKQDSTTMINYVSGWSPSLYCAAAEELLADPVSRGHSGTTNSSLRRRRKRQEEHRGLGTGKMAFKVESGLIVRPLLSPCFLMYTQTSARSSSATVRL